jgi:hypothetical protein
VVLFYSSGDQAKICMQIDRQYDNNSRLVPQAGLLRCMSYAENTVGY